MRSLEVLVEEAAFGVVAGGTKVNRDWEEAASLPTS